MEGEEEEEEEKEEEEEEEEEFGLLTAARLKLTRQKHRHSIFIIYMTDQT